MAEGRDPEPGVPALRKRGLRSGRRGWDGSAPRPSGREGNAGGGSRQERKASTGVLEGWPGPGSTPTVTAAQAFFLESYTKMLERYTVYSKYSQMIVATVFTILLKV